MSTRWLTFMWRRVRGLVGSGRAGGEGSRLNGRLDAATLRRLVEGVLSTEEEEIGCDECFEELDRFAELVLAGREIPEALRLVQAHLERCGDCREEFEALLAALRQMSPPE